MQNEITNTDSYMDRNGRWLRPLLASLIILSAPALMEIWGQSSPLPIWATTLFAAIGFGVTGAFAMFTETFSAQVVRWLAEILAVALLVSLLWNTFFAAAG